MKTSDFDYSLPAELIAQIPLEPRDHSRLMVLNRHDGLMKHRRFFEVVEFLRPGDVLVFNDTRVIPARLSGQKASSGGRLEIDEGIPKRFKDLIGYRGTTIDPLELFISSGLTSISKYAKSKSGIALANVREVPFSAKNRLRILSV
jgi:hypothetical protein